VLVLGAADRNKGVTWVSQAAVLQLNPAEDGCFRLTALASPLCPRMPRPTSPGPSCDKQPDPSSCPCPAYAPPCVQVPTTTCCATTRPALAQTAPPALQPWRLAGTVLQVVVPARVVTEALGVLHPAAGTSQLTGPLGGPSGANVRLAVSRLWVMPLGGGHRPTCLCLHRLQGWVQMPQWTAWQNLSR
jgi:hypothetical protein